MAASCSVALGRDSVKKPSLGADSDEQIGITADRRLFRKTFEAFRSDAEPGLTVEGALTLATAGGTPCGWIWICGDCFARLCQHCFLFTKSFGPREAQEVFWEVALPGKEMDLNCFEAALSLRLG
eukprot:Skav213214  [mRNA]  locus=scaffold2826:642388:644292:- [translate_table: standard]